MIVEGMLKLSPNDRITMQEAVREYQSIGITALHKDKNQAEEKIANAERDKLFLRDQVIARQEKIVENLSLIDCTLEKQQRAAADDVAHIVKAIKNNSLSFL